MPPTNGPSGLSLAALFLIHPIFGATHEMGVRDLAIMKVIQQNVTTQILLYWKHTNASVTPFPKDRFVLQHGRRQPMISWCVRSISAVITEKRCSDPQALTNMAVRFSRQSE